MKKCSVKSFIRGIQIRNRRDTILYLLEQLWSKRKKVDVGKDEEKMQTCTLLVGMSISITVTETV